VRQSRRTIALAAAAERGDLRWIWCRGVPVTFSRTWSRFSVGMSCVPSQTSGL